MDEKRAPLHVFTSFRFFAAMAVVGHHFLPPFASPEYVAFWGRWLLEGCAGVSFFFILSGFILTYNYRESLVGLERTTLWNFYANRFARIYPVHLLTFGAMFIVAPHLLRSIWSAPQLANLLLVQSWIPKARYFFSQNPVSWSLSNEAFFYAMLPFLLWGMCKLRLQSPARSLLLALGVFSVAVAISWTFRNHPDARGILYINPLFRLHEFILGIVLALVFSHVTTSKAGLFQWSPRIATALELGSLALLGWAVSIAHRVPFEVRITVFYSPFMALVIFVHAFGRGWISQMLSVRPMRFLGEISYSIYMFHLIVLSLMITYRQSWKLAELSLAQFALIYLAVLFSVSALSFCCFETPMRQRLKTMLQRKPKKATEPEMKSSQVLSRAA